MSNSRIPFAGLILCGGRSTRMGRPKLSLPFGPETMLARVVRTVAGVVRPVVVVAAPGQEVPELPGEAAVVRDEQEGLGPLGGLATGLASLRTVAEAAYVSSCDAPLLQPAFIQRMTSLLGDHELVILRDGKYHHPLAAVYRTHLEDRVRELIAAERLRPFFLVESCDSRIVDVEELRDVDPRLDSLRNTNTPADYAAALHDAGLPDTESNSTG